MNKNEIPLYNPDTEDFNTTYDINEDGIPVKYVLHAGEIEYFPETVADNIRRKLADRLVRKRGIRVNYDADLEQALKEIKVQL